jgi:hypothetical protein
MKKIPTLFKREFENHSVVRTLPEVTEGLEWVLEDPDVYPTVKVDGSCCAIINREFYKRYDAKNGKPIPKGAIKCQDNPDPVTGHMPCWVKCDRNNPADKWFWEAYDNYKDFIGLQDGTYEAIGKHFQGNPYKLDIDRIEKHGIRVIYSINLSTDVKITYDDIKEWLKDHEVEGIVFWKNVQPICKIKRSDFGFEWPIK